MEPYETYRKIENALNISYVDSMQQKKEDELKEADYVFVSAAENAALSCGAIDSLPIDSRDEFAVLAIESIRLLLSDNDYRTITIDFYKKFGITA